MLPGHPCAISLMAANINKQTKKKVSKRKRERERARERERDRQTDRHRERERHTHTHTQRERERERERDIKLILTLPSRYKKNLKAVYIVHPTFWCKVATWWFSTFTVSDVKDKIHNLDGVRYLFDYIAPDQIEIPEFVFTYDASENGTNYHTPVATSQPDAPDL